MTSTPFVKRAWKVGRAAYGATFAIMMIVDLVIALTFAVQLAAIRPEEVAKEVPYLPLEVAYVNFKALIVMLAAIAVAVMAAVVAAMVVGGSIRSDSRNGVYEVLLGNGVAPDQLAKALFYTAMSAVAAFYLLAVALTTLIIALAAPEAWPILPAAALAALASVFSAAALILAVGLAKPQLFKIRTGVGATQNMAHLLALLPSMALTFVITPFLTSLDVETATIVISAISAAVIVASIAAVLVAPRFLNREELIAPGD